MTVQCAQIQNTQYRVHRTTGDVHVDVLNIALQNILSYE